MTPIEVAERLEALEELRFQAFDVALRIIAGEVNPVEFADHADAIETMVQDLEKHIGKSSKVVERCLRLPSIPGALPPGF